MKHAVILTANKTTPNTETQDLYLSALKMTILCPPLLNTHADLSVFPYLICVLNKGCCGTIKTTFE